MHMRLHEGGSGGGGGQVQSWREGQGLVRFVQCHGTTVVKMTFIYCHLIPKTHLQYSPVPGGESDRMIPIFKETKEMWSRRSKGTFLVTGGMWALPGLSYSASCGFVPFLMPLVHQQDPPLDGCEIASLGPQTKTPGKMLY